MIRFNDKAAFGSILFILFLRSIKGCSLMPPCDVIANAIELTNVTGILHVSLEVNDFMHLKLDLVRCAI